MISVCIPTYNGEKYIEQQLRSILNQLSDEDEVVISDDSSTDGTLKIIRNLNDRRIILLEQCTFGSPIYNLENALKFSRGDHIFLSDQDDVWAEHKVATTLPLLTKYDIVVCDGTIIDDQGNVLHESYFKWKGSGPGFIKNFIKNTYLGCSIAFNRKLLNYALPFPSKIAMHDIWIGLVAETFASSYFLNEQLFYYRRHTGNLTAPVHRSDKHLSNYSLSYKIGYRMLFLWYLFIRSLQVLFRRKS